MKSRQEEPSWVSLEVARVIHPGLLSFHTNLRRVDNLVSLYRDLNGKNGRDRKRQHADLLRAAVVLLHASFEEFMRNIARIYLPTASSEILDNIPLAGSSSRRRPEKFGLGSLLAHRQKSVENLLSESIEDYLERTTYNDTREVAGAIEAMSIPMFPSLRATLPALQEMMARRHKIVHEADGSLHSDKMRIVLTPLHIKHVSSWVSAVRRFVTLITAHMIDREIASNLDIEIQELHQLLEIIERDRVRADEQSVQGQSKTK